ncbi:Bax inhibitor-1/YccA family protein [Alloscardovia theropitheci]|nr:Bax inhibitor-1/YccA family protein [Alloscardovia theropitheci]
MTDYNFNSSSDTQPTGQMPYQQPYVDVASTVEQERAQQISVARTYGEMTIGLLVTAAVAYLSYATGLFYNFIVATGRIGFIGLIIVQLGVVFFLSARALKMNPATARVAFYAYAALMGFTLSTIFAVYSLGNIILALAFTAGFFFALTMFALTTKMDLLKLGPILTVALIVLIVAEVIMMFMNVGTSTMVLSAISLIIFAGFTAYDAQVARALFAQYGNDTVMIKRISIICALNLYLDFINFFLSLLQILGNRD